MMRIFATSILLAVFPFANAIPAFEFAPIDTNLLGQPFINAILPVQPGFSPRFSLFRRQGCPNLSLLCPSGGCCSYDTSCCGSVCCQSGYLCTGGTTAAPCCVAETSPTNECGGSNGNPCTVPGQIPCNGINICCPPNNLCYYDSSNIARCSPLSSSPLPPTTTSSRIFITPTPIPFTTTSTQPIPTTTPIPAATTTTPYPYPSSSIIILPSYSGTFWTPAAIGGLTGGAVGGAIILAILIYICIRRRRSHSDPIADPSVKPLTNDEIYMVVQGLTTTQEWQEAYIAEAKRTRAGQHLDRASWMKDFGTRAVEMRIQQLRDGGDRNKSMWKAGAIAFVPLVKYWGWFRDSTATFNRVAIDALGMGDSARVEELYRGAKAAADRSTLFQTLQPGIEWLGRHALEQWSGHSDLAEQLQQELVAYLGKEMGQQAATELMTELVHLKPIIGQIISGTRAMWKGDAKMLKALQWLQAAAIDIHLRVFAVNALAKTFPQDFGLGIGEKEPSVGIEGAD